MTGVDIMWTFLTALYGSHSLSRDIHKKMSYCFNLYRKKIFYNLSYCLYILNKKRVEHFGSLKFFPWVYRRKPYLEMHIGISKDDFYYLVLVLSCFDMYHPL